MEEPHELLTIPELVSTARAKLSAHVWDYSCGGAETETTLKRNRSAFDGLALKPRVLAGVDKREISTTLLGHRLSLPVILAPVGSITHFHPEGALACARVAEQVGTLAFIGTLASPKLEDVRKETNGPLVFQLYVQGDRRWVKEMVHRVEMANYSALCLTVDLAAYGRRERDLHNRFFPRESVSRPNSAGLIGSARDGQEYQARFTWDDLEWLREITNLPLILKGVLSPEDAELAVQRGVDAIYVSNHGGRQLDHAPSTIEVLPEIMRSAEGRAEIIVDSGFMRGTDIIKALALGARAVAIGKLMAWGLAAGGEEGLRRTLKLLETEIDTTMANMGVRGIDDIGPQNLRPSSTPHPSPWPVGIPEPASVFRPSEEKR